MCWAYERESPQPRFAPAFVPVSRYRDERDIDIPMSGVWLCVNQGIRELWYSLELKSFVHLGQAAWVAPPRAYRGRQPRLYPFDDADAAFPGPRVQLRD